MATQPRLRQDDGRREGPSSARPVEFLAALDITEPSAVSFAALESYQRHLFHHKKADGAPLSFRTQAQRVIPVKAFFAWMLTQGRIRFDPAVGLVLPKAEHRLPEATLSAEEAEAVLQGPDVTTVLGVRDRAILEVLYDGHPPGRVDRIADLGRRPCSGHRVRPPG